MAGISFRPTKETEAALVVLMERWKCRRSHAINRALQEAVEEPAMVSPPPIRHGKDVSSEKTAYSQTIQKPDRPVTQPARRKTNPMTGKSYGPVPK